MVTADARAQQVAASPEDTVRVTLTDGDVIVGTVVSETEASIVVLTVSGVQMTIPREQVRSIESLEGRRFDQMDPNRSRLLFAPTGRSLEKGRGYIAVYELFFPFVAYGPGGNVTLAGGVSLIPGAQGQLVYAAPKITLYERRQTSVAAGILASTYIGESIDDDVPTFGLLYAVGTVGSSRAWLTGGLAFGFADGEISKNPAILVGGELQLSNSVKLMSENYVFINVDRGFLMSGGLRFFGERIAVDLAMVTFPALLTDIEGFPFFPWIGFAYNFGP
jgi:hypothetical protein